MGGGHSLSLGDKEKINEQMLNSLCIIKINKIIKGTGFLFLMPYPNLLNLLPVMITTNEVLKETDINLGNQIKILLKNSQESVDINISSDRKVYRNQQTGITIIEIKDNEIDFTNFLEVDKDIYKDNLNNIYKEKSIYLMNRSNGYILGEITKINGKNIDFTLKISEEIKNGPIMTLNKFGVIGIYNRENDINNLFIF